MSVAAVDGINDTLSLAHSRAFVPYARDRASRAYATCYKATGSVKKDANLKAKNINK